MSKDKTKTGKREFKTLTNNFEYLDTKKIKKGFQVEGKIVEIKTEPKKKGFDEQKRIVVKTADEKNVCMPSHYTINNVLKVGTDESTVGCYVRLTYEGQTEKKGQRKGVHLWKVEVAK